MISKYTGRLLLVPFLAKLGRLIGMTWEQLGNRLGREVILAQADEICAGEAQVDENCGTRLDIVFLTMIGGHSYNTSVDIVLGLALKSRGHNVRFVVCDQALTACEVKKVTNKAHWNAACNKCWKYGRTLYNKFGFELIPVSELINSVTDSKTRDWDEIVEASLLKHYAVGVLDESEAVKARRHEYQTTVERTQKVGEALVGMKPDRVLMSHGLYSTWGPQLELLNEAKIPVVTFSKCKKKHTKKLNWKTSADWWDVSKEWTIVRDTPLTEPQMQRIDSYLDSRRDHSSDTLRYNFGSEETRQRTFERLHLDGKKKTFVAYTNVLWDAASAHREIVFDNPIAWITETIEWFREQPDMQLVVKIHPAEVVIGTNQPFSEIIAERVPALPHNVRIIEPEEKVNSWSIMQIAEVGLVHTSTIGMEMPLEGIPCIVVSRTHFRNRGFTIDVKTKDEYFGLLENWNPQNVDIEEMKVLAKRYAFLLFERYQLPFHYFHEPEHTDVRALKVENAADLAQSPVMSLVLDRIEDGGEFLLPAEIEQLTKFEQ